MRKRLQYVLVVFLALGLAMGSLACPQDSTNDDSTNGDSTPNGGNGGPPPAPTGDYGDAPDGGSTGYPSIFAQTGNFPTLSTSNGAHTLNISQATLGPTASMEVDANDATDPDGVANLINADPDDGLTNFFVNLVSIPPPSQLSVRVEAVASSNFFLNVLIDLDMDGNWGGSATGGEAEWVVQNLPVSLTPGTNTITPPPFAFANGNLLPDGAWARIALTSESVSSTDWDGSGSFASGEIEDHRIILPEVGGKKTPILVVTNDGPYPVPGPFAIPCTVTVTNLGAAGSFNWTLTPLTGDVLVSPLPGPPPPLRIEAAGDLLGDDVVTIVVTATNGTKASQWLFKAIAVDPDAVVVTGGITVGYAGESTTILDFEPQEWEVFVTGMEGFYEHYEGYSIVGAYIYVGTGDDRPMPGAIVDVTMSFRDFEDTIYTLDMSVTTDQDGMAYAAADIFSYATYSIAVNSISGTNMAHNTAADIINQIEVVVE